MRAGQLRELSSAREGEELSMKKGGGGGFGSGDEFLRGYQLTAACNMQAQSDERLGKGERRHIIQLIQKKRSHFTNAPS
jgi:hypothetical protein